MRLINPIIIFLLSLMCYGQEAVHNYGTIQIHDTGLVGFHMDVINDGAFNRNMGLVGFYGENKSITLSGISNPVFYDTEVAVDENLYVNNTIGILNNLNLISGDIITSRSNSDININFQNEAFYTGEGNATKIDGYAAISNKDTFTFPVGQDNRLRPLSIASNSINDYAKSAYFYEDPNSPSIFGISFNTENLEDEFLSVNTYEFWHLDSNIPSQVTLTWDENSYISLLAEFITDLKVVGWSAQERQWVNLGNADVQGDMENGSITSEEFIPNDYQILTIGGNNDMLETLSNIQLDNYYMTPNGDGVNDTLVIEGIENSPNNNIQIFDRYGVMVYSRQNYNNDFNGISNRESVLSRNKGLASGIYYYIITLNDLNIRHQGYLYLTTYQNN